MQHGCGVAALHQHAGIGQRLGPQQINQRHHGHANHQNGGQRNQRGFAAGGQHPVENLHHVKRGREHEEIDGKREYRRPDKHRHEQAHQRRNRRPYGPPLGIRVDAHEIFN